MKAKKELHPRSQHKSGYDFEALLKVEPGLKSKIITAPSGRLSINFADSEAVTLLNAAILKEYYWIRYWTIPRGFLCPPIPGRADYIHYAADLLGEGGREIPRGEKVKVVDIGTGANLVYPIIGQHSYGWSFIGAELDKSSFAHASHLLKQNEKLQERIEVKLQKDAGRFFDGILEKGALYSLTICNPPFYSSAKEAMAANSRKQRNLGRKVSNERNFGGQANELWCKGGELPFIQGMLKESQVFKHQVLWFTSLVSQGKNLKAIAQTAGKLKVADYRVIEMAQGQKKSRFIAWTFMTSKQQRLFKKMIE